jgi:hypothetical protein
MRAGAFEPGHNLVALGDQVDDLHLEIRKRALKRANPPLCDLGKLATRDLIENIDVSFLDSLMNQPPDQQLVALLRHPGPIASSSTASFRTRRLISPYEPSKSNLPLCHHACRQVLRHTCPLVQSTPPGRPERTRFRLGADSVPLLPGMRNARIARTLSASSCDHAPRDGPAQEQPALAALAAAASIAASVEKPAGVLLPAARSGHRSDGGDPGSGCRSRTDRVTRPHGWDVAAPSPEESPDACRLKDGRDRRTARSLTFEDHSPR